MRRPHLRLGARLRRRLGRIRRWRPSPRLPVIVLLSAAIGGAAWQARVDEARRATAEEAAPAPAEGGDAGVDTMPALASGDALTSTWYCAAGTGDEGGMADHTIAVFNPSDRELDATVTVYPGVLNSSSPTTSESAPESQSGAEPGETESGEIESGEAESSAGAVSGPVERRLRLPAGQAVELRLGDVVAAPLVAALVEAHDAGVAVEHRVQGPHGEDAGPCAPTAAPEWHMPWGATTRDAREVLVLFNPFPTDATVDVVFETDDGPREPVRYQGFPVAAGSVVGVDLGDDVTRKAHVSATLRVRTGRVVVERLQAFDGSLGPEGLSMALGVPGASPRWAFATGIVEEGRAEKIVVYNPSPQRAEVEVSVLSAGDGPLPQPFHLSVPSGGVSAIDYRQEDRIARGTGYATIVDATNGVPVVAERVITAAGDERRDITAGPGSVVAARTWTVPSAAERLIVFNPDDERSVRVSVPGERVEVAPGGRATLRGAASVEADAPVVVERRLVDDGLPVAIGVGIPSVEGSTPLSP